MKIKKYIKNNKVKLEILINLHIIHHNKYKENQKYNLLYNQIPDKNKYQNINHK